MAAAKHKSKPTPAEPEKPAKPAKKKPKPPRQADPNMPWPGWLRALLSVLVILHVLAVFVAPWRLQTGPSEPIDFPGNDPLAYRTTQTEPLIEMPPLIEPLGKFFRHYQNLLYLNHGYDFFTPNPSGSNILRCYSYDAQGSELAELNYPDLKAQWPRLFYHRHLMLAAQGGDTHGADWARVFGKHLIETLGADHVELHAIYHRVLSPQEVIDGTRIDDPSTYRELEDQQTIFAKDIANDSQPDQGKFRAVEPVQRARPVRIPGVGP